MPSMIELHYRKPNEVKQDYAARIDQQQWQCHEGTVRHLHEQGKTRKEIIRHLREAHAFHPTLAQLNAQMRRWGLKVYGKSDTAPREIVDVMPLYNLPRQEALSMSDAICLMDTAEDCVDPLPEIVLRCSNLGIDRNPLNFPQNEDTRVQRATEIVHEFHQQPELAASLIAEPLQDVLETSMITFTAESSQRMSLCGRSSTSHCTRSTFATHASDTSSLREFRATAARAYHASVSWRGPHAYRESHKSKVVRLLNSWVFIMADVEMFREVHGKVCKVAMMIGRYQFDCICKSEKSSYRPLLQEIDQISLNGLLEDLSRLQAQGSIPANTTPTSPRKQRRSTKHPPSENYTSHPLIAKFDCSFAKRSCLYCLMKELDRLGGVYPDEAADPGCPVCNTLLYEGATGRTPSEELAMVFREFCLQFRSELIMDPSPEFILGPLKAQYVVTDRLHQMYNRIKCLQGRLLKFHQ